jgi:uncharacterized membrane protein
MLVALLLVFWALPWLSPKQFELDSFRSTYWFIVLTISAAMAFIHGLTLWAAFAIQVDITRLLLGALLVMFALIGNVLGKVRRNFWVGVRTPWTIANDRVWNETHRLAGRLFVGAAGVGLIAVLLPIPVAAMTISVFALIMAAALWPVVYSLILYKRLVRKGEI